MSRLAGGRAVQLIPMMRFTVLLAMLQCVALVVLGIADTTWLLFVGIVLFGMAIGNILMLQPLLIAERFGVRDYAQIYSRSQFVAIVGTAGGPLIIGYLYDVGGSYRMPYAVAAVLSLLGGFCVVSGRSSFCVRRRLNYCFESPANASTSIAMNTARARIYTVLAPLPSLPVSSPVM